MVWYFLQVLLKAYKRQNMLMFSLLLLLIWTLGAQSSAPMWVSVSISIHSQMKIPSDHDFLAHILPPSSHLNLGS